MRPDTLRSLELYIDNQVHPGGFLIAVLNNDLKESFARADDANREDLFAIVSWIYCHAPTDCWGSPEKVRAWLNPETALKG